MEDNQKSNSQAGASEEQKRLTITEILLAAPQPRRQLRHTPRPVVVINSPSTRSELDAQESENLANATTEDFKVSMSRGSYYNDGLDLDQQSQEYWDSL